MTDFRLKRLGVALPVGIAAVIGVFLSVASHALNWSGTTTLVVGCALVGVLALTGTPLIMLPLGLSLSEVAPKIVAADEPPLRATVGSGLVPADSASAELRAATHRSAVESDDFIGGTESLAPIYAQLALYASSRADDAQGHHGWLERTSPFTEADFGVAEDVRNDERSVVELLALRPRPLNDNRGSLASLYEPLTRPLRRHGGVSGVTAAAMAALLNPPMSLASSGLLTESSVDSAGASDRGADE